jgi:hypothetical protein
MRWSRAYDAPFGPTVVGVASTFGLLAPTQLAFYQSMPVAADSDSIPNDKDDFVKSLVNSLVTPLGYSPSGCASRPGVFAPTRRRSSRQIPLE